jgi:hypothetical protein
MKQLKEVLNIQFYISVKRFLWNKTSLCVHSRRQPLDIDFHALETNCDSPPNHGITDIAILQFSERH